MFVKLDTQPHNTVIPAQEGHHCHTGTLLFPYSGTSPSKAPTAVRRRHAKYYFLFFKHCSHCWTLANFSVVIPAQAGIYCPTGTNLNLHTQHEHTRVYYMKSGGYVYILASGPLGTLYIGSTSNLVVRISQHKHKEIPGFTSKYNVDKLVYYEWHDSLKEMVLRERQLKQWHRNWKIRLIVQKNPNWVDLYPIVLKSYGYATE